MMQQVLKKISCAYFILFCLAAAPHLCQASNIAVITRNDIIPYTVFLEGYTQAGKSAEQRHAIKIFEADPRNPDNDKDIAGQVAALKPDILLCIGLHAVTFRQIHFPNITMIYSMVFGTPGQAIQGKAPALELSMNINPGKKIAVLRELHPNIRTIGAVYDPNQAGDQVTEAIREAKKQGLAFDAVSIASSRDAMAAVEAVFSRTDAFMLFFDKTVLTPQVLEAIFTCSFRSKAPVIGLSEKYVNLGALFAIECDVKALGQEAWRSTESCLADREKCSGVKTAQEKGRLVINKKIADKMGLKIPDMAIKEGSLVK